MVKRFLKYVEIKTKVTSTFAFAMALAYLFYQEQRIDWALTLLFFGSMFLFDLATTAINHYIDTKAGQQMLPFTRPVALRIIIALLAVSGGLGLYLALKTDLVVFSLGGLCFLGGVLYTYGPIPISRQPLGELLSGIFYGLLIPFILFYINMPEGTYLTYALDQESVTLSFRFGPLATVLLLSVPPVFATANIMLANNICDLERDVAVKRHTLPYYIGGKALCLFAGLYYAVYAGWVLLVILGKVHPICLLALTTLIPVQKNIARFRLVQDKATTFSCSVRNYVWIMGSFTLMLLISRGLVG